MVMEVDNKPLAGERGGGRASIRRMMGSLDLVLILAFVVVSGAVLLWTTRERASTPIRVWIAGYAVHCLLHMGFVVSECSRRRRRRRRRRMGRSQWGYVMVEEDVEEEEKDLEESMQSRLIVMFLAFDVFFTILCIILACIVGIALSCCLPCIMSILYAMAGQEGASDADLRNLPKFKFRKANRLQQFKLNKEQAVAVRIEELNGSNPVDELVISPDDSECCICLSQYEDGAELYFLPCNHHFHSRCITTWLRINTACALCKYNILEK